MVNKLLRVTQMNAIYLDNEIYKTFQQLLRDAQKYLPPGLLAPYEPEFNMILKLVLLYNSVYKNNSTLGQQLLSIKYENMSKLKKLFYITGNCLEYFKIRLELWKPSHDINKTIHQIYMIITFFSFLNTSFFLSNGVKPLLIERLLNLKQVYESEATPRQFESKYLARELLWNGFIEILVYILPIINYHKLRRMIRNYNPFHKRSVCGAVNRTIITIHSKCAYCGENPILPHHMGCAHVFCYICLKGNQIADSKFECPVCEYTSPNVVRLTCNY